MPKIPQSKRGEPHEDQIFHMKILGRTIEHLGTQMYKHRAPSIAELIANCWDAGATKVWITIPLQEEYSSDRSIITILDDGEGMDPKAIEDHYLVVGRNRREDDSGESHGRQVMGRKGIGKLAGFGLASEVTITTWTEHSENAIRFSMSLSDLKRDAGQVANIPFPWTEIDRLPCWPRSGTRIKLSRLRHTTAPDIGSLAETLSRRFSRTTRGEMQIYINDEPLTAPVVPTIYQYPKDGDFAEEELENGRTIKYRYSFAERPIRTRADCRTFCGLMEMLS